MIGISFNPGTGTLTVVGHSENGTPLFMMSGMYDDCLPFHYDLSTAPGEEIAWHPTKGSLGLAQSWLQSLGMVKIGLMQEKAASLDSPLMAGRVMDLLRADNLPFYIVYTHEEMISWGETAVQAVNYHLERSAPREAEVCA